MRPRWPLRARNDDDWVDRMRMPQPLKMLRMGEQQRVPARRFGYCGPGYNPKPRVLSEKGRVMHGFVDDGCVMHLAVGKPFRTVEIDTTRGRNFRHHPHLVLVHEHLRI
jgi:hypothetical protein